MSGWSVPELGAARINAACVLCIVPAGSVSLLLPGFIFFKLSNLTLKVWLANLAFAVQGNPTLCTFSSVFTQLLFDVLFAFCCASSKGHWYSMGWVIYWPTESTVLGSSLYLLWCQTPSPAENSAQWGPRLVRPWVCSGQSKVSSGGSVP